MSCRECLGIGDALLSKTARMSCVDDALVSRTADVVVLWESLGVLGWGLAVTEVFFGANASRYRRLSVHHRRLSVRPFPKDDSKAFLATPPRRPRPSTPKHSSTALRRPAPLGMFSRMGPAPSAVNGGGRPQAVSYLLRGPGARDQHKVGHTPGTGPSPSSAGTESSLRKPSAGPRQAIWCGGVRVAPTGLDWRAQP